MKKLIIAFLATSLVSACGWHLRGSTSMPLDINSVYVTAEDSYGSLVSSLKQSLASNQVEAVAEASAAQYRIILSNEKQDRRTVSVGNDALAAEYELSLSVDYVIENAAGEIISPKATASSFRAYDFDRDAVVAKNEEERLILAEMRNNVVQQILRRLRFVSQAQTAQPEAAAESANAEDDANETGNS